MDAIQPVNAAAETAPVVTTSAADKTRADYDNFLSLLVAQLKNQDPTEPTENSELIAQLASFSAVEQQTQTNAKLDQLLAALSLDQTTTLIGMHVATADGSAQGVVTSVTLGGEGGSVLTLKNGEKVVLQPGIIVTDPKA